MNDLRVLFLYKILAPKVTKQNLTRKKLPKRLTYEKGAYETLMKFTPEVSLGQFSQTFSWTKKLSDKKN